MMQFVNWWEAKFLQYEFILSILITAVLAAWYYRFGGRPSFEAVLQDSRRDIYGALAGIFGALLGFVITAVSIVLGYAENRRLKIIRESTQYPVLWGVFRSTMKALAFATITALVGLVFDRDVAPVPAILFLNVMAAALAGLRVARSIWVLENIVNIVTAKRAAG